MHSQTFLPSPFSEIKFVLHNAYICNIQFNAFPSNLKHVHVVKDMSLFFPVMSYLSNWTEINYTTNLAVDNSYSKEFLKWTGALPC